ncbi:MAG: metallophosphoesterase [Bacteroidales bacterium]|nr:metallophosphoesterase [Bacteroidales bacterium]
MKKYILILAAALAAVSCCRRPELVIIHTNDTHSHLEPLRAGELAGHGGVIERAAAIDSIRNAEGEDRVLLLHAGDFGQGTSYFTEMGGRIEMDIINAMHYDVICLGNHEFDNDIEALTERIKMLKDTKVVCANLDLSPFELGKYVQPYAIVHKNGLKIGIIGLDTDLSTNVTRTVSSRIPQLDRVEVTEKWTSYLRNEEKCDKVILLTHIGYSEDQKLVPQTHGVDLLVGGHSHTFVEDILYVKDADGKDVPIITDGCWGMDLGVLKMYR